MSTNSKMSIAVDKYSGDSSVNPDMFVNEIDTWIAFNGVTANQQQVMALHLTGAANEWYFNEFAKLPAAQRGYDGLQNRRGARFSRGCSGRAYAIIAARHYDCYQCGTMM